MQTLESMFTVEEVDQFVGEIARHVAGLEQRARSRSWSAEERAADTKLDRMCAALERRDTLEAEIASGMREADGKLNPRA